MQKRFYILFVARSDDGQAISKGTEVVITRYEKGIAYVRRWDELAGQQE